MRGNPNDLINPPTHFVKAGELFTVTIGRNLAGTDRELRRERWIEFQDSVRDRLTAALLPSAVFGPFTGEGEWEGVTEESSVLTLIVGYTTPYEVVNAILSGLADTYNQEAIAWSHGPSNLARRPVTYSRTVFDPIDGTPYAKV